MAAAEQDIRAIPPDTLRRLAGGSALDVLAGSPPCQGFSLIGKRLIDDPRNGLVFHFFRLVKELRPRYFVMENVPELLENAGKSGFPFEMMETSFFVSRETLIPSVRPGMARWRERLFSSMSKNAVKASDFFHVPTNRVVELGTQVEL